MSHTYLTQKCGPLGEHMRVEVHTDPDALGRCLYTLFWMRYCDADISAGIPAGIRERAQEFFAIPPEEVKT